jgi:hypothetical protein
MMPDVGQRAPQKSGRTRILEITNVSHWEIFVSLLVRDGVNFLFIIVDFSVISLIKADIFSLFHRGAFPEKAVSTVVFYFLRVSRDLYLQRPIKYLYLIFNILFERIYEFI